MSKAGQDDDSLFDADSIKEEVAKEKDEEENPNLPELSLVLLVWSGLILFLIRAISQKDMLYIISNLVGFILNSILLLIIVL